MERQTYEAFAGAFPIEIQLRAERELRQFWQAKAEAAERRRIPPERKELEAMARDHKILEIRYSHLEDAIDGFCRLRDDLLAQIEELKAGAVNARLERERDDYKRRWEHAVQRIGYLLEHQGSVELLEAELAAR